METCKTCNGSKIRGTHDKAKNVLAFRPCPDCQPPIPVKPAKEPQGTPQSLNEALDHVAQALGQTWTLEQRKTARMHLRDFMAQRFGVAMYRHEAAEDLLKALFQELFG